MGNDGRDSQNRLGLLLVRERLISPLQLHKAIETQRSMGGRLGHHLINLGFIREDELTAFLSKQYGVPSINLSGFEIDPEVLEILPKEIVSRHQVLPINRAWQHDHHRDERSVEPLRDRRREVHHELPRGSRRRIRHRDGGSDQPLLLRGAVSKRRPSKTNGQGR
jgi:hypothetical protein